MIKLYDTHQTAYAEIESNKTQWLLLLTFLSVVTVDHYSLIHTSIAHELPVTELTGLMLIR